MEDATKLNKILEEEGGKAATLTREILLRTTEAPELREPLNYLTAHRRDVLRPSIISLSCEAAGAEPEDTLYASVAMVLECYNLGLIDDILDESKGSRFSLSLPSKFGTDTALIASVLVKGKIFDALAELSTRIEGERFVEVNQTFSGFLVEMIEGENLNMQVKHARDPSPNRMLDVFSMQASDIKACAKIGAIIAGGTNEEIRMLAEYGTSLGVLFLLKEDTMDALNLSARLADKIERGSYPYPYLWSASHSAETRDYLATFKGKNRITPREVKKCVDLLYDTEAIEHVNRLMENIASEAIDKIESIRENEGKKYLELLARAQPHAVSKALSAEET